MAYSSLKNDPSKDGHFYITTDQAEVQKDSASHQHSIVWGQSEEAQQASKAVSEGSNVVGSTAQQQKETTSSTGKWTWLLCAVPFTAGICMPVAGALNAQGRKTCGSQYFTVALTYSTNMIICGIWAFFTSEATWSENYFSVGRFISDGHWFRMFCLCGGILGAAQHVISGLVSLAGGSSIYTLGALLGSVVTGILLDLTGICWAKKVKPTIFVYIGAVAVIVGAVLHSFPVLKDGSAETSQATQIVCLIVSIVSGACTCFQACAGNKLASLVGAFRRAAVWSYISGALTLYLIGPYIVQNATLVEILKPRNWWKISQGPLSIYMLVSLAVCQRWLSGAMVYCWYTIGQLVGATILDSLGWIGLVKRPIDNWKIIGLVVVLIGVCCVTVSKLMQKPPSPPPTAPAKDRSLSRATDDDAEDRSLSSVESSKELSI